MKGYVWRYIHVEYSKTLTNPKVIPSNLIGMIRHTTWFLSNTCRTRLTSVKKNILHQLRKISVWNRNRSQRRVAHGAKSEKQTHPHYHIEAFRPQPLCIYICTWIFLESLQNSKSLLTRGLVVQLDSEITQVSG